MKRKIGRVGLPLLVLLAVVAACTSPVQGGGAGTPGTNATPAPSLDRYNY